MSSARTETNEEDNIGFAIPSTRELICRTLASDDPGVLLVPSPARSPTSPSVRVMIDNGASETAAVADVNKDGRLDIISGENWYESARPVARARGSGRSTSFAN